MDSNTISVLVSFDVFFFLFFREFLTLFCNMCTFYILLIKIAVGLSHCFTSKKRSTRWGGGDGALVDAAMAVEMEGGSVTMAARREKARL
jgi:hypothetical protein